MNKAAAILKDSALILLLTIVICITIVSICLLFHGTVQAWDFPLAFLAAIGVHFFMTHKSFSKTNFIWANLICFFVISIGILISAYTVDLSWDGNTYHKDAVGALKNGWNPIYEDYLSFYEQSELRDMNFIGEKLEGTRGFWQTYYAKGTWYLAASLYAMTGNIECGKGYSIWLTYILFVFTFFYLHCKTHKKVFPFIFSTLVSVTPVTIVQILSYYNDGLLALTLTLIIESFLILLDDQFYMLKWEKYLWICCGIGLIIQIKFTGFGYAGIFCLFFYIMYVIKKMRQKEYGEIRTSFLIFTITTAFSIGIVGYSPYITNTLEKQNPLYPLAGANKVDIVTYNQPISYNNKSTFEKLVLSIFSRTENINAASGKSPDLKPPFHTDKDELHALSQIDMRIGGFGVLFGGIVILSIVILLLSADRIWHQNLELFILCYGFLAVICVLLLGISESWWARYTPYLYYIPLLTVLDLYFCFDWTNKKIVTYLMTVCMLVNILLYVPYGLFVNLKSSNREYHKLRSFAEENEKILVIDTRREFTGYLYNLDDLGISYHITTKMPDNYDGLLCNKHIFYRFEH